MFEGKYHLHRILEDSIRLGANMVILKANGNSEPTDIHLYINDNQSAPTKLEHNSSIVLGSFTEITKEISDFSFSKHDLTPYIHEDLLGDQNILINSKSNQLYLGRIIKNSNSKASENSFQIFIKRTGHSSVFDILNVSDEFKGLYDKFKTSNVVILFNKTNRLNSFIISSVFSDSQEQDLTSISNKPDILSSTPGCPIFIGHNFEDPVDGIFAYLELIKDLNIRDSGLKRLAASVILKPLKKQCGICSKPTAISSDVIERFPKHYQPKIPKLYQFSRGCKNCGFTSYRGMMTIESILQVPENIKAHLKDISDPSVIYSLYKDLNAKSIFDDAIEKICAGAISAEEVSSNLPQISNAFSKFLNFHPDTNTKHSNPKILIIEDDLNQRDVLELVFRKEGYEVLTAENGIKAIETLKQTNVSVIVSDIMMPEMNGLEFLKFCKTHSEFKSIPILMLTASANPDHELTMLEEGADDYCPKNSKKKVILKRVEKLATKNFENPLRHLI